MPESPDDDNRESTTAMKKNSHNITSKGVATSFGFKRRPTTAPSAMSTPNSNVGRRLANVDTIDSNGNDRDDEMSPLTSNAQPSGRSTPRLPPPKKEGIASHRVSRFGFRQPQVNRMNKVADLNSDPQQFGEHISALQRPLPTNTVSLQSKYKSNNVGVGVRTTIGVDNNRNRTSAVKKTVQTNQIGKYTLQTNQLPKPQSVRVMETKTAKTLANNNMKLANTTYRRSSPDDSSKDGSMTEDSGLGSHVGTDDNSSFSPMTAKYKQRNLEIMLNGNTFDVRDVDDSTEVPLPKLPCAFQEVPDNNSVFHNTGIVRERTLEYERQIDNEVRRKISATSSEGFSDASCQNENSMHKPKFVTQQSFLKAKPSPVKIFLKSKVVDNKGYSSSASSDEHEWAFGGEAMADEVSFSMSSSDESRDKDFEKQASNEKLKNITNTAESNPFIKKTLPTLALKSGFQPVTLTIADSNLNAIAATGNSPTLLDDETSPIESLLSFSETDEISKKKENQNAKDMNDKSSPGSPGTPTNASNSLSLSEGKDDFLIDDEIADQPGLVFGDKSQHNSETTLVESTPRARRRKLKNFEGSPLILKEKKNLRSSNVSLDTLSPCESIASDDLMMDYEYSQSSGLEDCDRFEKKNDRSNHIVDETLTLGSVGSIETEIRNNEQIRDWTALLNYTNDKNAKR
ncbi:hypothetical protein HHI36_013656 [Cryptolaemus montrouzieri]|uniref:Uncharacterized protein n=1 Tax=Cryptolaemus montrouzieri TaxID=559131 RepID=A0ABD2NHU4_9CUCU